MSNKDTLKRRELLKLGAAAGTALAAGNIGLAPGNLWANPTSNILIPQVSGPGHVVKVHMPGMRGSIFPHSEAARIMVEKAVTTLAGEPDPGKAWLKFISTTDKVGIKVNCLGTRMISSMKEVAYAVAASIRDAGVQDANILILDMFASNMRGGRYEQQPNPRKMRTLAHKEFGYQKSWMTSGPAKAKFSDIYLEMDSIINLPVLKDHDLAGVTCCMKNMTFGVVEKPHVNHRVVNEALCHLWALDEIRGKVKLNIIDGSTVLYDGGPKYNRRAHLPHESIYATTDPVAMDSIARELIAELRAENGLRTLEEVNRPPKFLALASQMGLGISDRTMINLQTVDLPKFSGPAV